MVTEANAIVRGADMADHPRIDIGLEHEAKLQDSEPEQVGGSRKDIHTGSGAVPHLRTPQSMEFVSQ